MTVAIVHDPRTATPSQLRFDCAHVESVVKTLRLYTAQLTDSNGSAPSLPSHNQFILGSGNVLLFRHVNFILHRFVTELDLSPLVHSQTYMVRDHLGCCITEGDHSIFRCEVFLMLSQ